jgi:hypothetical protein
MSYYSMVQAKRNSLIMKAMRSQETAPYSRLSRIQWAAAQAIKEGNTFLVVNAVFQNAGSTIEFIEPSHRFVADDYGELRCAIEGIAELQRLEKLGRGGLVVLSGHSIALAAFSLSHPQKNSEEWVSVGQLSCDLCSLAPNIGWVLLNVCFPTSVLESRHAVPERLKGREGIGYHSPSQAKGPCFVAPRTFGSNFYGLSALQGGRQPVTEPLIEMLSGRVTTRAFVPALTMEQALRIVKGDDRLYERLDLRDPSRVCFSRDGASRSISIHSTPRELDEFRRFSGSAGIRTGCREYLLAARTLAMAGLITDADRLKVIFSAGSVPDEISIPADFRVPQTQVLKELWEAVLTV